ncbi:hypothetical protein QBC32DRAFT_71278 [Pseudoneurospora amorphoporcata]|uniref:Transmembrane protein n=1 Tax=Pseudoneurospora amorphoporcata TaxID=241081 RepID=A0AAN6NZM8_9PEZI|nr:hypothetical protein QBC32DRAFT_71278 [Pseudoneurospora amorphoporcata]
MGMALVKHNNLSDRTFPSSSAVGSHTNRRAIPQHLVDVCWLNFSRGHLSVPILSCFPVISCKMIKYLCLFLNLIFLMFEIIGRAAFFLVIGWVSSFVVFYFVRFSVVLPNRWGIWRYASRPVY